MIIQHKVCIYIYIYIYKISIVNFNPYNIIHVDVWCCASSQCIFIKKIVCYINTIFLNVLQVTQSMAGVVKAMDAAMKSMNLEKISSLMDKFENQFEDLDVQSSYMENTMSQTTTTAVPQGDVENLMQQVADEAG